MRLMERQGAGGSRVRVAMSKILLAEDDVDMRRFLVKALQNAGFDVVSYDNGLSAYQRLREEPFELLLTDIVMPEMDVASSSSPAAPPARPRHQDHVHHRLRRAVALNSDSSAPKHAKVLSKPIHLRELVNEVQKLLRRVTCGGNGISSSAITSCHRARSPASPKPGRMRSPRSSRPSSIAAVHIGTSG